MMIILLFKLDHPNMCQCKTYMKSPKKNNQKNNSSVSKSKTSKNKFKKNNYTDALPKCPKLSEFFTANKKLDTKQKQKCKLTQCDVTVEKELCMFRTVPKKQHCLLLRNLIYEMLPIYKPFLNHSKIRFYYSHGVKEVVVNTCSKRVSFTTLPHGNFTIIPNGNYLFIL